MQKKVGLSLYGHENYLSLFVVINIAPSKYQPTNEQYRKIILHLWKEILENKLISSKASSLALQRSINLMSKK